MPVFPVTYRTFALHILLVLSIAVNFFQARHIRALQTVSQNPTEAIKGTKIGDMDVVDMSGNKVRISFSGVKATVLYIFRPDCTWCQRNGESLASMVSQLPSNYRIIGLSLNSHELSDFTQSHHMLFPVYFGLAKSKAATLHLGATPQTLLISRDGTVEDSINGAFTGETRERLNRILSISIHDALAETAMASSHEKGETF